MLSDPENSKFVCSCIPSSREKIRPKQVLLDTGIFHKHATYILNIPTPDALSHPAHLISYDNCLGDNKIAIRKVFRLTLHIVLAPSVSELSHHYSATQVGCEEQ